MTEGRRDSIMVCRKETCPGRESRAGEEKMDIFLTLAFLFFIGSVFGWVLELFFRRFISAANPERKWINPGFCTGP